MFSAFGFRQAGRRAGQGGAGGGATLPGRSSAPSLTGPGPHFFSPALAPCDVLGAQTRQKVARNACVKHSSRQVRIVPQASPAGRAGRADRTRYARVPAGSEDASRPPGGSQRSRDPRAILILIFVCSNLCNYLFICCVLFQSSCGKSSVKRGRAGRS